LDDRYHQANAKVATITGTTTTSMIAVELIRRSRCADAMGPCGFNTPAGWQDATRKAAHTTGQTRKPGRPGWRCGLAVLFMDEIGPLLRSEIVQHPSP
jgi:hypothetical protein